MVNPCLVASGGIRWYSVVFGGVQRFNPMCHTVYVKCVMFSDPWPCFRHDIVVMRSQLM